MAPLVRHRLARPPAPFGRARRRRRAPGPPRPRLVVALFDVAAREAEKRDVAAVSGAAGVRDFLSRLVAQQIPADTLAEQGVRGAAVRLLTAHRSKGLEWDLVVVAHVQQDGLARPAPPLDAAPGRPDRRASELVPPLTARELLAEERRLFYVACTRARSRLVVTAVASRRGRRRAAVALPRPSSASTVEQVEGRPGASAVAGRAGQRAAPYRRRPRPTRAPLRAAAARRLARLAGESVRDRPLVPQADPSSWWGTRAATRSVEPVRDPDRPVPVSASDARARDGLPDPVVPDDARPAASGRAHQSANIGQLVHALAQRVATGEVEPDLDLADGPRRRGLGPAATSARPGRPRASTTASSSRSSRFLDWHDAQPARAARRPRSGSRPSSSSRAASRSRSSGTPTGSSSTPTAAWSWST